MYKYEIIIYWSDEDNAFLAEVPELPGCIAHGDTYESALLNAKDAIQLWIDTAREFGDTIPQPKKQKFRCIRTSLCIKHTLTGTLYHKPHECSKILSNWHTGAQYSK